MSFTQISFLFLFMPVSILTYFTAYKAFDKDLRVCNALLVCHTLIFYWWAEPRLLVFYLLISVLVYCLGNRIHETGNHIEKKKLTISIISVLALIPAVYKYLPALRFPLGDGQFATLPIFNSALVPLGISFFALEAISYVADIYRGNATPGSLLDVLTFMLVFPKAACGPIVLWRDFFPQLHKRTSSLNDVSGGVKRIIIGYAKKAIIADTFAAQITLINSKFFSGATDTWSVWLMVLLYFFRIYYDFSGYSDIAIGLMKIFGFSIEENFKGPYMARSLTEFWRRWHISLGMWFREYVYIPLGGNRKGNMCLNILITFLLAGLWHGWRLPILIWSLINGLIVITEKTASGTEWYKRIPAFMRVVFVMMLVCLGWILFSAPDMKAAGMVLKGLFVPVGGKAPNFTWCFFITRRTVVFLIIAAAGVVGFFQRVDDWIRSSINSDMHDAFEKVLLLVLFAVSIMYVMGTSYTPFIYTNF